MANEVKLIRMVAFSKKKETLGVLDKYFSMSRNNFLHNFSGYITLHPLSTGNGGKFSL